MIPIRRNTDSMPRMTALNRITPRMKFCTPRRSMKAPTCCLTVMDKLPACPFTCRIWGSPRPPVSCKMPSCFGKFAARIALQIEQRAQVAMIDADIALSRHRWFGMKRDTRACKAKHPQIVRPVANGDHIGSRQVKPRGDVLQRLYLRLAAKDGPGHIAGQQAIRDQQSICLV